MTPEALMMWALAVVVVVLALVVVAIIVGVVVAALRRPKSKDTQVIGGRRE